MNLSTSSQHGSLEPISPIQKEPIQTEPSSSNSGKGLGAQKVYYEPGFVDHNGNWRKTFEVGFYDTKGVWIPVEPKDSFSHHPRIPITLETIHAYASMRGTIGKKSAPIFCDRLHCALYQNPSRFVYQEPVLVSIPFYGQIDNDLDEMVELDPEKIYFYDPLQQPDPLPPKEVLPQYPETPPKANRRRPLHGGPVGELPYSGWVKRYPIQKPDPSPEEPLSMAPAGEVHGGPVGKLTYDEWIKRYPVKHTVWDEFKGEKLYETAGWVEINNKWVDPDDWGQVMAANVPDNCNDPSIPKYVPPILPDQKHPRNEREQAYFNFKAFLDDPNSTEEDFRKHMGSYCYPGPKLTEEEEKEKYPEFFGLPIPKVKEEVDQKIGSYFTEEEKKKKYPGLFGLGFTNLTTSGPTISKEEVDKKIGSHFTEEQKKKYPILFGPSFPDPVASDPNLFKEEETGRQAPLLPCTPDPKNDISSDIENEVSSSPPVVGGNIGPTFPEEEREKPPAFPSLSDLKTMSTAQEPKEKSKPTTRSYIACLICPEKPQCRSLKGMMSHLHSEPHLVILSRLQELADSDPAAKEELVQFTSWLTRALPAIHRMDIEQRNESHLSFSTPNPEDDVFVDDLLGAPLVDVPDYQRNVADVYGRQKGMDRGEEVEPNPATHLPKVAPVPHGKAFELKPATFARWAEDMADNLPPYVDDVESSSEGKLKPQEKLPPQDDEALFRPGTKVVIKVDEDYPDEYMSDQYEVEQDPVMIHSPPGILDMGKIPRNFERSYPMQYQYYQAMSFRVEKDFPQYPNYSFATASTPETFTEEGIIKYFATDGLTREEAKEKLYETKAYMNYLRERNEKEKQDRKENNAKVNEAHIHEIHARHALGLVEESLKNFLFDSERRRAEKQNFEEGIYRESEEGLTRLAEADQIAMERFGVVLREVDRLTQEILEPHRIELEEKKAAVQAREEVEHVYSLAQLDYIAAYEKLPPRLAPLHVADKSGFFKLDHPSKKQYRRYLRDEVERRELEIARFAKDNIAAAIEESQFQHQMKESRVRVYYLQLFIEDIQLELLDNSVTAEI